MKETPIYLAPFIKEFTKAIILTLGNKEYSKKSTYTIHADIIPKFSDRVTEALLREKTINPEDYRNMSLSIIDQQNINIPVPEIIPNPQRQRRNNQRTTQRNIIPRNLPSRPTYNNPELSWQKLDPLMKDQSISSIECPGPRREIMIIRGGMRQKTRITFSQEEIRKILQDSAELAHVPLLEGVFRAVTEEFLIHAVVSDMIGSKFVIKKKTPYAMFEQ